MGQQEVYDFLMKNPDQWYTSKQISEQLIVSIGSVTMSLKKLRKTNIIKYRNTGKRNTFQYMVQSEPAKLAERKTPLLEQTHMAETKIKVKIKPKIVHQHTYLGGQTFYGVIRPKEEVEAIERQREEVFVDTVDEESDDEQPQKMLRTVRKQARKVVRKVKVVKKARTKTVINKRMSTSRMKVKRKAVKSVTRKKPLMKMKKSVRR